jgi:hypothetical protein
MVFGLMQSARDFRKLLILGVCLSLFIATEQFRLLNPSQLVNSISHGHSQALCSMEFLVPACSMGEFHRARVRSCHNDTDEEHHHGHVHVCLPFHESLNIYRHTQLFLQNKNKRPSCSIGIAIS